MSYFQINKIDAIGSTNVGLKESYQKGVVKHGDVLWALDQTQGKGQRAAHWVVEPNKNLTFSFFLAHRKLALTSPFQLNCLVALAIKNALIHFAIPAVSIKWPNDILSDNKKLCGVLIENVYRGNQLQGSIVGIGLNVNQEDFSSFPRASSMRLCSGVQFKIKEVLDILLEEIECLLDQEEDYATTLNKYNESLFGRHAFRVFRKQKLELYAKVEGVNQHGYLALSDSKGIRSTYQMKEIEWVY